MRRRITTQEELDRPKVRRVIVLLVAGTLVAGIMAWLAGVVDQDGARQSATIVEARPVDPLRAELLRCNGLGQAALEDAGCRQAWAENRRRFFGAPKQRTSDVNASTAAPSADPHPPAPETPR